MKRLLALLSFVFIISFCLSGCEKQPRKFCRLVTQVDISCQQAGETILRHYTDEEKMEAVLLYLRCISNGKISSADPDAVPADLYQITVSLSDGQQRVYSQKDHRYFRKGNEPWQSISPVQAAGLYRLIYFYESDQ